MDIKDRIKELREYHLLTQTQLANNLNQIEVSKSDSIIYAQTISYWENGRDPSLAGLIKLAKFFNVSIDYILGLSSEQNLQEVKYKNFETFDLEQLKQGLSKFDDSIFKEMLSSINKYYSTIENDYILADKVMLDNGWKEEFLVKIVFLSDAVEFIDLFYDVLIALKSEMNNDIEDKELQIRDLILILSQSRNDVMNALYSMEQYILNEKSSIVEYLNGKHAETIGKMEIIRKKFINDKEKQSSNNVNNNM